MRPLDHGKVNASGATTRPVFTELVAAVRDAIPATIAIYLFGSWARGHQRPDSDLDLGIVVPPAERPAPDVWLALMAELTRLAGRTVDVTVLDIGRSTVLCKEAVTGGQLLFTQDPAMVARFEMDVLGAYARLNEDRRPVLAAYTGAGHG